MKTILVADDSRNIREFCRATLEDDGYRVLLASDGLEAIRVFFEQAPDLAILDISMPKVNGLEALDRINMRAPDVPVILFTAHDEDCLRDRRSRLATACIGKSGDLGELKRTVCRAFAAPGGKASSESIRIGLPPLTPGVRGAC
jgi:CheY-like chemotaxis protein